jgi:hypothetical protein
MIEYILLGSAAAVILLQIVLRTNTAIVFFALCAGSVLLASTGDNVSLVASSLTSGLDTSTNVVKIILLFAPMAVCLVMLSRHISASLLPLAFIPAVCSSLLGIIFITPQLSDGSEGSIVLTDTWKLLMQFQEPIVVIGLISSIIIVGLTIKKPHNRHHKKGRH